MPNVQLAGNGLGGTLQGAYGTYNAASDGSFTVDVRDAAACLAAGMSYMRNAGEYFLTPVAPRAASAGRIGASTALSNGPIAIANAVDVGRALNVIISNGSTPLTAGAVVVAYKGMDNALHTDSVSAAACAVSTVITQPLSRAVAVVQTMYITGIAGGAGAYARVDDTNLIGLPSDPFAVDFSLNNEWNGGTLQSTTSTASATAVGATGVQNTPNSTITYGFLYGYVSPTT